MSHQSPRSSQRRRTTHNATTGRTHRLPFPTRNPDASSRSRVREIVDLISDTEDEDDDDHHCNDDNNGLVAHRQRSETTMLIPASIVLSSRTNIQVNLLAEALARALASTSFQSAPLQNNAAADAAGPLPSAAESPETSDRPQEKAVSGLIPATMRILDLLFKRLGVVVAAYLVVLCMIALGSHVFQAQAERTGEELYVYLAGMTRDMQEYRFIFLIVLFFVCICHNFAKGVQM